MEKVSTFEEIGFVKENETDSFIFYNSKEYPGDNFAYNYQLLDGMNILHIYLNKPYMSQGCEYVPEDTFRIEFSRFGSYKSKSASGEEVFLNPAELYLGKLRGKDYIGEKTTPGPSEIFSLTISPKIVLNSKQDENIRRIVGKFYEKFKKMEANDLRFSSRYLIEGARNLFTYLEDGEISIILFKAMEILYLLSKEDLSAKDRGVMARDKVLQSVARDLERFFRRNLSEDISIKDYLEENFIDPNQFNKVFKKLYNQTPYKYLSNLRMMETQTLLLETDLSITDISLEVGYRDLSSFCRAFKNFSGYRPLEYRKINCTRICKHHASAGDSTCSRCGWVDDFN